MAKGAPLFLLAYVLAVVFASLGAAKNTNKNRTTVASRLLQDLPYDDLFWDDLPRDAKQAARALGYNENRWNEDRHVWTHDFDWNDLSQEVQEAASFLGYTGSNWYGSSDGDVDEANEGREGGDSSGEGDPEEGNEGNDTPEVGGNPPSGNTICQTNRRSVPHMAGRWINGFPVSSKPTALCNAEIWKDGGNICVRGRATFQQILDAVGGKLYTTSSSTVSVNGLLVSGQGNVGLGSEWRYIYDFVTSYTVNGRTYTGGNNIVDQTLAGSRGTVDGFCLDSSIQQGSSAFEISTFRSDPFDLVATAAEIRDATIVYISYYVLTAEFHRPAQSGASSQAGGTMSNAGLVDSVLDVLDGAVDPDNPNAGGVGDDISGALSTIGLIRYFQMPGVYRTGGQYMNGIYDGDEPYAAVEQIQMDTEWNTFVNIVADGWFDENEPPVDMIVSVRHVKASRNSKGCWKQDTAAIVLAAPSRSVNQLESYTTRVYGAIDQYGGTVTIHLGKRIPRDKSIVRAALRKFERCGVELDVSPSRCIHPLCRRREQVTSFTWPGEYYA